MHTTWIYMSMCKPTSNSLTLGNRVILPIHLFHHTLTLKDVLHLLEKKKKKVTHILN